MTPEQNAAGRYQAALWLIRLSDELRLFQLLAAKGFPQADEHTMDHLAYGVRDAERAYESYRPRNAGPAYRRPERFRDREERGFRP